MRFFGFIGLVGVAVAIAAGVFFFGGFYSVAGTQPDPVIVATALTQVREASISRHARETSPVSLDDPAVVQQGARAFVQRNCAVCHGGPGLDWSKFSEGMHPSPPDLKEVVGGLEPREIFWVIKNGINMTGMPSFGPTGVPDQEIWTMVAFLKKLPTVSEQDFKSWVEPSPAPAP
jgi:mono/diheme cytochrome c family protein